MLQTLKSIPQTFFSRAFYFDLIHSWKGIGAGFVVLLVLFDFAVPMAASFPVLTAVQQETESFFGKLPDIKIESGKLSTNASPLYTVEFRLKDEKNDEKLFALMFDMNFQSTNVTDLSKYMKDRKVDVLITADYLAAHKADDGIEIHKFDEEKDKPIEVTHEKWVSFGNTLAQFFPVIFVFALIPIFAAVLFIIFVKALLVKLAAFFFKTEPDLSGAMRLAAAAAIPPSLIRLVLMFVGEQYLHRFHGAPSFLMWAALAIFGLWCASQGGEGSDIKRSSA